MMLCMDIWQCLKNMYVYIYIYMGVSKNRGTPKSSILIIRVFPYKPSILGYPYSWKHPHIYIYNFNIYIPWESRTIVKMGTASAIWSRAAKTLLLKLLKRLHAKESNSV